MHFFGLNIISNFLFSVVGILSSFLTRVAEKIGMAEWSTISLNDKYYEYFFILLIVGCLVIIITKKWKINITKHITMLLSVVFAIIAVYCTSYDYNTVSVEVCATEQNPIIIVNYSGESLLLGTQEKKDIDVITDLLNKHNQKCPDILVINETNEETIQEISNIYDTFGRVDTYFHGSSPQILSNNSQENVNALSIREKVILDIKDDFIVINGKNNKQRVVPISPILKKALMRYDRVREEYFRDKNIDDNYFLSFSGKTLNNGALDYMIKKRGSGIKDCRVSVHTMRHFFAQQQIKMGTDLFTIQRLLGHENISITQIYLNSLKDVDIIKMAKQSSVLMNM